MEQTKQRFLKLAEQLDSLADLAIRLDGKLSEMKKEAAEKNTVKLDPAQVLNFAKFYLKDR